jgi:hypothetical protein
MAIYLDIVKVRDDGASAEYAFCTVDERCGKLRLEKKTGEVLLVEAAENDDRGALFARAAHKVKTYWSRGELPDKIVWAS